jgi:branched-chain amino acid transport system substrate-binding protein
MRFAAILLLCAFLTACALQPPQSKVKVGVIAPLTGSSAYVGQEMLKGIELAADDYPNIELMVEDSQSDNRQAIAAYRKLQAQGARIIIGSASSGETLAIAPLAEQDRVILLNPVAGSDKIADAGDYVFRIRETARTHGRLMAEYAISKGCRRVAVISLNAENGISYTEAFRKRFEELGGSVVAVEMYEKGDHDMSTQVLKARAKNPDVVYLPGLADGIGESVIAIREAKWNVTILSNPGMEDQLFFRTAGDLGEGVVITSPFDPERAEIAEYQQKLQVRFGNRSESFFTANGYDAAALIAKAAQRCSDNTGCIKAQLYATRNYTGVSGTFSFDEKGEVQRELILKQVRGRKFERIERKG